MGLGKTASFISSNVSYDRTGLGKTASFTSATVSCGAWPISVFHFYVLIVLMRLFWAAFLGVELGTRSYTGLFEDFFGFANYCASTPFYCPSTPFYCLSTPFYCLCVLAYFSRFLRRIHGFFFASGPLSFFSGCFLVLAWNLNLGLAAPSRFSVIDILVSGHNVTIYTDIISKHKYIRIEIYIYTYTYLYIYIYIYVLILIHTHTCLSLLHAKNLE